MLGNWNRINSTGPCSKNHPKGSGLVKLCSTLLQSTMYLYCSCSDFKTYMKETTKPQIKYAKRNYWANICFMTGKWAKNCSKITHRMPTLWGQTICNRNMSVPPGGCAQACGISVQLHGAGDSA